MLPGHAPLSSSPATGQHLGFCGSGSLLLMWVAGSSQIIYMLKGPPDPLLWEPPSLGQSSPPRRSWGPLTGWGTPRARLATNS